MRLRQPTFLAAGFVAVAFLASSMAGSSAAPAATAHKAAMEWQSAALVPQASVLDANMQILRGCVSANTQRTAYACFTPDTNAAGYGSGEFFRVIDRAADGQSAGVYWELPNGRHGMCINSLGYHPDTSGGYCHVANASEGQWWQYKVARCDGSAVNCHSLANWTQWSCWRKVYDDADTGTGYYNDPNAGDCGVGIVDG
jgi:hypothetical protein